MQQQVNLIRRFISNAQTPGAVITQLSVSYTMILKYPKTLIIILSVLSFLPFFMGGYILGGTDVQFTHFPNIIFGYDQWKEYGTLSLWNPYIFAGSDMTGSMHALHLNPLFWPLALLDREYILHGVTAIFYLSSLVIAFSWYRMSNLFTDNVHISLSVSGVSIIGIFFWFTTTTLIAVPMYALSSLAIYAILTHNDRSSISQMVYLSLIFGVFFIFPHPAYIVGFGLPIASTFIYLEIKKLIEERKTIQIITVGMAVLFGIGLASYRLLPVFF
ncbi:hypothetical protein N9J51_04305, partial [Alphaproteobacteria bacterium]|nr:hypothetical protein [Alphaproteobacteria bacterium]